MKAAASRVAGFRTARWPNVRGVSGLEEEPPVAVVRWLALDTASQPGGGNDG